MEMIFDQRLEHTHSTIVHGCGVGRGRFPKYAKRYWVKQEFSFTLNGINYVLHRQGLVV